MNAHKLKLVIGFLEELSERYGNDGCNDFEMEYTPENLEIVTAAEKEAYGIHAQPPSVEGGKIHTTNFLVLDYVIEQLKGAATP
jgi:hypothetical protein